MDLSRLRRVALSALVAAMCSALKARAGGVPLPPVIPVPFGPGPRVLEVGLPPEYAMLIWAPILLLTIVCAGTLLVLVSVWRYEREAAVRWESPADNQGRAAQSFPAGTSPGLGKIPRWLMPLVLAVLVLNPVGLNVRSLLAQAKAAHCAGHLDQAGEAQAVACEHRS